MGEFVKASLLFLTLKKQDVAFGDLFPCFGKC